MIKLKHSMFVYLIIPVFILTTCLANIDIFALNGSDSTPKISTDQSNTKKEIIVKFNGSSSEAVSEQSALDINDINVKSIKPLVGVNAEVIELGENQNINEAIEKLAKLSNVSSVEENKKVYAISLPEDPLFNLQWGLLNNGQQVVRDTGKFGIDIDVLRAWKLTTGSPTLIVGVLDTGIDIYHTDLQGSIYINPSDDANIGYKNDLNGWNFYNNDNTVFDSNVADIHGTHVAGIIAASSNSIGIAGIAPNIKILPLKFLGPDGSGNYSDVIRAIAYAKAKGVKIINCSWGGPSNSEIVKQIMLESGILFVCAAGNNSYDMSNNPFYPASFNLPNTISVAAVKNEGQLAYFSNYGSTVDIAAPGYNVISTFPSNRYAYLSGTSMAAPFVTGVAALIMSQSPGIPINEVKTRIKKGGFKIDSLKNKVSTSAILDAYGALTYQASSLQSPTNVTAQINEPNISIQWDLVQGASGYEIEKDHVSIERIPNDLCESSVSSVVYRDQADDFKVFRIRAINGSDVGEWSIAISNP